MITFRWCIRSCRRSGSASECTPQSIEVHFWLALVGTLIYVFAMWNSGIIQGLMWRTYSEDNAWSIPSSIVWMRCIPITSPSVWRVAVSHRHGRRVLQCLDDRPHPEPAPSPAGDDLPIGEHAGAIPLAAE